MFPEFLTTFVTVTIIMVGFTVFVSGISVEQFLTMSLEEKNALDEFRARVEPILHDDCMRQDTYLIRWLRARNFNIDRAENMLRENLKWRQEQNIDNIKNENFRDIEQEFPVSIDTYDKVGQPIGVCDIYDWDIRRGILQGKGPRGIRYVIGMVENITGQLCDRQKKGMNVTQVVVLINADGVNVIQQACPICLPLWIQFVSVIENYYPEVLDEFIVIDASSPVYIVLNAVRPIFSKSTNNAIKVFGHNRDKWMAYLDNKISRSERRKEYGGTRPPVKY